MPIYKLRVAWEDDDNVYRDIEVRNGQSFLELKNTLLHSFEFKEKAASAFFESNEKWQRKREISSEVLINKKDAPALSMVKTPVSALLNEPDKRFIYEYDAEKPWTFLLTLIGIRTEEAAMVSYPLVCKVEGVAPSQTGIKGMPQEKLIEIEEKYDLAGDDITEGFGNEGEEEETDDSEDFSDDSTEELY